MIFNANKFGKSSDSANNSVSPSRRGTTLGDLAAAGGKTPRKSQDNGASMVSANSSGKFSIKNVLGEKASSHEPLELMSCPSHDSSPLDHYSINIREFMCRQCIKEIEGTQREVDLNPIPIDDALKVLESRLNMQ